MVESQSVATAHEQQLAKDIVVASLNSGVNRTKGPKVSHDFSIISYILDSCDLVRSQRITREPSPAVWQIAA
jgi:hypothetical protein